MKRRPYSLSSVSFRYEFGIAGFSAKSSGFDANAIKFGINFFPSQVAYGPTGEFLSQFGLPFLKFPNVFFGSFFRREFTPNDFEHVQAPI
ncbi:MAG: hypothetical protein JWL82_121 [Parcubacteria group bacterium]|nr:hypothetical protein [Parcubacteria group bacterium]